MRQASRTAATSRRSVLALALVLAVLASGGDAVSTDDPAQTKAMRACQYTSGTCAASTHRMKFAPMPLAAPCSIWYVGAFTKGIDGQRMHNKYPCTIHVFEPVKPYIEAVRTLWQQKGFTRAKYHAYGLAASSRHVDGVTLLDGHGGAATFGLASNASTAPSTSQHSVVSIELRSVAKVWRTLVGEGRVDYMFINCEGCEYEVLPAMAGADLLRKVRYLDWRPHGNFHQMERIPERYCAIERQLSATHACAHRDGSPKTLVHWERWANLDRAASSRGFRIPKHV